MAIYNFQEVNSIMMQDPLYHLAKILPGGTLDGDEYCCSNIEGGSGKSLKFNIIKGVWSDFATGEGGPDFISLFAIKNNLNQFDALKKINEMIGNTNPETKSTDSNTVNTETSNTKSNSANTKNTCIIIPPKNAPTPNFTHFKLGGASDVWKYVNPQNRILFYIARYNIQDGKEFRPFSWSSEGKWVNRLMTDNRPLYNLHEILSNPDKPIMIVEGEKAADAAMNIVKDRYIVTTWTNGSNSVEKTNWKTLKDRNILIWPDADAEKFDKKSGKSLGRPGIKAAFKIAALLHSSNKSIKLIDPSFDTSLKDGFDAADALDEKWDFKKTLTWARKYIKVFDVKQSNARQQNAKQQKIEVMPRLENIPTGEPPSFLESDVVDAFHDMQTTLANETPPIINSSHKSGNSIYAKYGIEINTNGRPVANDDNALRVIQNYEKLGTNIWYDEFHKKIFVKWPEESKHRPLRDSDEIRILIMAQREMMFANLKLPQVKNALMMHCETSKKNEPLDWINSLEWDGKHRVSSFYTDYFGANECTYTAQVSQNFWVAMIARIVVPGCKVDNVVILEGAQGIKKSAALEAIGGDWYVEAGSQIGTKDFYLQIQGKLIVEIAELDAFSNTEINTVKKIITQRIDCFRPPYGRSVQNFPRQCLFVGTTNQTEYLKDATGARRFLPMTVGSIDIEGLRSDREQLFAEAYHLYRAGKTWWKINAMEAKKEADKRHQVDIWHDIVMEYISMIKEVTIFEIMKMALNIEIDKMTKNHQIRVANILKFEGWQKGTRRNIHGKYRAIWVNPETPSIFQ